MPLYSNLTLDDERFVELRRFKYDFRTNEFSFSNSYKEIDEDFKEFFNPHFSTVTELKTKLEDEVYKLKENPGKFDFNISYYSKGYGLRYFRIVGSNERDHNIVYGIVYDVTNEHDLLQAVDTAVEMCKNGDNGLPVPTYTDEIVSTKIVKLIQSYTGVVNKMVWRKE